MDEVHGKKFAIRENQELKLRNSKSSILYLNV